MGFIDTAFYLIGPYTDASEKAVGNFFKGLSERTNQTHTRARLRPLLQNNIAVINLWTEYRYKGYKYLSKSERKRLYANVQLIAADFHNFYTQNAQAIQAQAAEIQRVQQHASLDIAKLATLQALMYYFSPARGVYEYRDSSSFGRLLRNPAHEKLVGDCNQIVTLYIFLYSRYHDVQDLRIRSLPKHVALHYAGIDIETTNGTLANYASEKGSKLLPVEEIVSINLLDTTDSYLSTHEVDAEDFLQAARFAFLLSHDREVVTHNLNAAYSQLVSSLMGRNNYKRALELASASGDMNLLGAVSHNGAVYEMQHHNYAAARRFAQHAPARDELIRGSWQAEGARHYKEHRYHDAIKAFNHIGDQATVRQCYEALFFDEQKKLGTNLTTETIRSHAKTIKRMHTYAKKSGNAKLIEHANSLRKHI